MPIYGLTRQVDWNRRGMQTSNPDCAAERRAAAGRAPAADRAGCGAFKLLGPGHLVAHAVTVPMLASLLSAIPGVGRPVEDRTGLVGSFDLELTWTPESAPRPASETAPTTAPARPSIFTGVEEQLGLELVADKRPTDVLIVDRAEPPPSD
jgi:uncharacterized protein (TIGR03435 family)